jgi:hypothetical protein
MAQNNLIVNPKNPYTIVEQKVLDTLFVKDNETGLNAKISQGNFLKGSWEDKLELLEITPEIVAMGEDPPEGQTAGGSNAYGKFRPSYNILSNFAVGTKIPKDLYMCPPTLGMVLLGVMPALGGYYRLNDGTLAVDNIDFINLFVNIQKIYNIEVVLGHDMLLPNYTWASFGAGGSWTHPVSPLPADLPTKSDVNGWLEIIHRSVKNFVKKILDKNCAKVYRYIVWRLTRWHLQKACMMSGIDYPMYKYNTNIDNDPFEPSGLTSDTNICMRNSGGSCMTYTGGSVDELASSYAEQLMVSGTALFAGYIGYTNGPGDRDRIPIGENVVKDAFGIYAWADPYGPQPYFSSINISAQPTFLELSGWEGYLKFLYITKNAASEKTTN